jgi:hypothetical protein
MGIPPFVLPRLADGGGKRRGNCLRAKPEFFRVPPSSRSKGSPQGQDWLGCLFLASSFGHAKEEKENSKKASSLSPEFPDEPKKRYGHRNSLDTPPTQVKLTHIKKGPANCGAFFYSSNFRES